MRCSSPAIDRGQELQPTSNQLSPRHYANNAAPTQIIMCDGTCEKSSLDTTGQIDIVLGCTTIVR